MVSTRSKDRPSESTGTRTGDKRPSPPTAGDEPKPKQDEDSEKGHVSKKAKAEPKSVGKGKGVDGAKKSTVVEKNDQKTIEESIQGTGVEVTDENKTEKEVKKKDPAERAEVQAQGAAGEGESKGEGEDDSEAKQGKTEEEDKKPKPESKNGKDGTKKTTASASKGEEDEPKHGTLESGHIYFLYRPKVETEDPETIDDVSKFHILLIPKTGRHATKGHYHRIIEVGKKKLPDPGAKHQVIWGLVGAVGADKAGLKEAFGAKDYQTKTRGPRHQPAARPAARGHYILHSPRDELADSPSHDRQRDYKTLLAYEITTPAHEDFGSVQKELGIEEKGAVVLQVKDPNAESRGNPRAAGIPREKRAQYPAYLHEIFRNRRFIPANPVSLLNYQGAEVLIITSPHKLKESLGKDGEKVEDDLDHDSAAEEVNVDEALKELGLNKKEFEEEALEGSWA
ncbi:hypothetical protein I316_03783 [Kwoniella heveanensis BCC8398]|uniref:Uncharacterized protein n=1 Tax=Kwoniella heveanensis BCC8398 TaxID=1296120 RepID=A0A1B9GUM4_9TREE|nr:hypothetical protein I316_03783 [Kwoniella heveanensis BCC8398]